MENQLTIQKQDEGNTRMWNNFFARQIERGECQAPVCLVERLAREFDISIIMTKFRDKSCGKTQYP